MLIFRLLHSEDTEGCCRVNSTMGFSGERCRGPEPLRQSLHMIHFSMCVTEHPAECKCSRF